MMTCVVRVDEQPEASIPEAGGVAPTERTEAEFFEEQKLLAEREEIQRRLEEGLPMPGEVEPDSRSAYQRGKIYKDQLGGPESGLLLARMTVSEGTSIMPLAPTWRRDMQGILQVVRTNQWHVQRGERWIGKETLFEALGRHSPHVARLKEYTRPRQRWTSTLPTEGVEPPELWVECTSWYTAKRGRRKGQKRGLPKGCFGVWENGIDNWIEVREYGPRLVKQRNPTRPVQGNPKTWGGVMDIWAFLERNPRMCWLESGATRNFFFGLKTDPENQCKIVPPRLMKKSRVISAYIVKRDIRRQRERKEAEGRNP